MNKKTQTVAFANLIGSLLFLALGVWAWIQMSQLQEVKDTYAQPSAFPHVMATGLIIFSVILLIQSIFALLTMKPEMGEHTGHPLAEKAASVNVFKDKGVQAALVVIALCAAFVLLFKPLGYVLTGALVSMTIMWLIGKRNPVQMVLVSLLVPLGMWVIFYKVLTVKIPLGPLTFLQGLLDMI